MPTEMILMLFIEFLDNLNGTGYAEYLQKENSTLFEFELNIFKQQF